MFFFLKKAEGGARRAGGRMAERKLRGGDEKKGVGEVACIRGGNIFRPYREPLRGSGHPLSHGFTVG